MMVYRMKDYDGMSRKGADLLSAQVLLNPRSVLGLATGSTPLGAYQELIRRHRAGDLDFSGVRTVNLDEYKGLAPDNDQSYRYFMNHNLFDQVNVDQGNTFIPNGGEPDGAKECARYDRLIQDLGGIDLQLLGIGGNGHIGFNEPDEAFATGTHEVALAQSTIDANKRFFQREEDVPRRAYTVGIRAIMQARMVVLLASGEGKAEILRAAFQGPVTPRVPASILQLHGSLVLVGDEAALSLL